MDKRKLYQSLANTFSSNYTIYLGTLKGYRNCVNDPGMVDYDILSVEDLEIPTQKEIRISKFEDRPDILMVINGFIINYALGTEMSNIENQKPSFRDNLSSNDQGWVVHAYSAINQAFIDAGYKIEP